MRRFGGFVLVLILMLALSGSLRFPEPARAATNVSGTISANTTWTLAGSPYVMTGNVSVAAGVTLTIEPGVVVQGNAATRSLTVNGSLAADGTSSQHITFTSTADSAPGQWLALKFSSTAGTSSLKYVDLRFGGGGGASDLNGMVDVTGGTLTIEDSTLRESSVSGLRIFGGLAGTAAAVTVRRTKFESNGFIGGDLHGDGVNVNNARVVIEDSAAWSNANDGLEFAVGASYAPAPSEVSGTSIYGNTRYGVFVVQAVGAEALGPDGSISGKPGNAVYENGPFGLSVGEKWQQFVVTRSSLSIDWSGTYWGPVTFVPCALGSQNGHLSFSAPDPDPTTLVPVPRGAVSFSKSASGGSWCGNDDVLVNAAALEQPDLHFDAPPPTFDGVEPEQTLGCAACGGNGPQVASALARASAPVVGSEGPWSVHPGSGSLAYVTTDAALRGPGTEFSWTRTYSSSDSTIGALGPGWTHPYAAALTVVNPTTGELEYRAGSGQRTRFTKTSGGASGAATYAGKGFDGTLKRLSGNTYEMTTSDQRSFSFDTSGKLTQIKPRFLPSTTLSYSSSKLSSITDSAGRTISITYTTADPTLIERVTLADGRYVEYGYTSGRLTTVQDLRGESWTLAYDGNGLLTSVQDPVGDYDMQDVTYDGQGRVTSAENGTGDATSYAYTTDGTYDITTATPPGRGDWVYLYRDYLLMQVTDPLGHTTVHRSDGMAREAALEDGEGNTTHTEFDGAGNVTKEVAPDGLGTLTRTYNASNDELEQTDGDLDTTQYVYATGADAAADYQVGQLKTITDPEGGTRTFKYWTATSTPTPPASNIGLLKSETNQRGKTTSFEYDAAGNLTKTTSPLGLKTTRVYDAAGRLTSERDPRGNAVVPAAGFLTEWEYEDGDAVAEMTDARGNVTTYDYYDDGLLWKDTRTDRDSSPRTTTREYDAANRLWKTTKPGAGAAEIRLYWPDGQLKSVESAEGRETTFGYDTAGRLVSKVDPNGNAPGATASDWTWAYDYDSAGNRTSETHPDGGTRYTAYDALNRPVEWTDAVGNVKSVVYDASGNIIERTDGLGNTKSYTYDGLNRQITLTDERLKTWTYAYFPTGELECVTTPNGHIRSYGIDDDGRRTTMVDPRAGVACGGTSALYTWTYGYDEADNQTQVTDPLGNDIEYTYNELNDLTSTVDGRGNQTTITYDVLNRPWKVTPPAAGATGTLYTEYEYDPRGHLASRIDPNGHQTTWTTDLDGFLTQKTTPVGTWNYTHFPNGTLETLEKPAGSATPTAGDGTITYDYDRMDRLTSVDYSDATPDVSRTYDDAGRPDTMTDGSGSVGFTYDDADRLTDVIRTGGGSGLNGTFRYAYDDAGNITGRTYPDSTTTTSGFDDDGNLESVTSASATTEFGYDEADNITTVTSPTGNGYVATRTFDRAGRLTTVENKKGATVLSKFLWTLDAAGNPAKVQTTRGVVDTYDAYEYDTRNRLTASCFGVASGATSCSGATNAITYGYDKVSNRTQEVRSGSVGNTGTINYSYNSADQLTQTTKSGTTTTYSYDVNGNIAAAGSRTFTYDLADRLATTSMAGTTITYGHDGDDRRISSVVSGGGASTRYQWDPLAASGFPSLALERDSSGTLVRRYLDGPLGPVSMGDASGTYYYHMDPLGTVTDVSDATGNAEWRYEYEAYGAELSTTDVSGSAPDNPLRFNHQFVDEQTDQYHLRAREYDAITGRFGSVDPVENAVTDPYTGTYVYAGAQPSVLVDPDGRAACDVQGFMFLRTPARGVRRMDMIVYGRCTPGATLVVALLLQAWNIYDRQWNVVRRVRGSKYVFRNYVPVVAIGDNACLRGLRYRGTMDADAYRAYQNYPHLRRQLTVTCP